MSRTTLLSTLLAVFALTPTAHADDSTPKKSFVAIPEQHIGNAAEISDALRDVFKELGPADGLSVLSATDGAAIVSFTVANKPRYRFSQYLYADYAAEKNRIIAAVNKMATGIKVAPSALQTNVPDIVSSIADMRSDQSGLAHALIIGSPLHIEKNDPSASMVDESGNIFIPSDALLQGSTLLSPYGLSGDKTALDGVVIHFCAIMPEISDYEKNEIARVWTHYFALRGGTMATFTKSLNTCVARFKARFAEPLEVRPLQDNAQAVMISAVRSTDLAATTVDERSSIQDQLAREKVTSAAQVIVLQAELVDLQAIYTSLNSKVKQVEANLKNCTLARVKAQRDLDDINAVLSAGNKFDGVTTFSRFQKVPHKNARNISVTTGVSYEQEHFPNYETSWCYFMMENKDGVQVRINIGDKDPRKNVEWDNLNQASLTSAGVSLVEFNAARQSCRFPSE